MSYRKYQGTTVFLICLTYLFSFSVSAEKLKVAVLDLKGEGVSASKARMISDLLRIELHKTGVFIIVERSAMDSILKEQQFSMSGCVETECAVEIGKLLSAKKMLVGTVGRLGDAYLVNMRLIDVEKGSMDFGDKAVADSEAGLVGAVAELSGKMGSRMGDGEEEAKQAAEAKKAEETKIAAEKQEAKERMKRRIAARQYSLWEERTVAVASQAKTRPFKVLSAISGLAGLGAIGFGAYQEATYDSLVNDQTAVEDFDGAWSKYIHTGDDARRAAYLTIVGYVGGGTLICASVFLLMICRSQEKMATLIVPEIAPGRMKIALNGRF